jgi:hypothetical protein
MLISTKTSHLLGAATLALAVSALSACSTEMDTDAIYTQSQGANNRDAQVDVLNAVIVSSADNKGTLVTSLVNNEVNAVGATKDAADQLVSIGGDVTGEVAKPVTIPAGGITVIATANEHIPTASPGIVVSGEFTTGDVVHVVLTFKHAGPVEIEIPVVSNLEGGVFAGQDGEPGPAAPEGGEESTENEAEGH